MCPFSVLYLLLISKSATDYPESHDEPRTVVEMRLFFTATPLITDTDKPKPSNQLATTTVFYDGGVRDFKIDMGMVGPLLLQAVLF